MHDDLRVGKLRIDISSGITMIFVLVRYQNVAQGIRTFGDRIQDRFWIARRID